MWDDLFKQQHSFLLCKFVTYITAIYLFIEKLHSVYLINSFLFCYQKSSLLCRIVQKFIKVNSNKTNRSSNIRKISCILIARVLSNNTSCHASLQSNLSFNLSFVLAWFVFFIVFLATLLLEGTVIKKVKLLSWVVFPIGWLLFAFIRLSFLPFSY